MNELRYTQFVGTGGIGTGILFELDSDRLLARNETRLARLSPAKDYCKQHIILHYLARTLTPEARIIPIGRLGCDAAGDRLLRQMADAGMDVRFVEQTTERSTMYCVCLQYPDKAVCNVTTSESACDLVDESFIEAALAQITLDAQTLVVAVPEVPVAARTSLLRRAGEAGAYRVSSCLVDEFDEFIGQGGLMNTDLLVINENEAAACCGKQFAEMRDLAKTCLERLQRENADIRLLMTCGAQGSWVCEGERLRHLPAIATQVVATGGAGDACTAGTICGLALGLPFLPEDDRLSAPELGARFAAEAIRDADTISERIDRAMMMKTIAERKQ